MPNNYNVQIFDPVATYQADSLAAVDLDNNGVLDADRIDHILQCLWDINRIFERDQAITSIWAGSGTGTADPTADDIVAGGTDVANAGINILTTNAGAGRLVFGDSDDNNVGAMQYQHNFDQFAWTVNGSSEMVLSSSYLGPSTTGGLDLGRTANRWGGLYMSGTINHTGSTVGFFSATPAAQQTASGATGFTAGSGNDVTDDATFTGGVGTAAYTIGDIVAAMKNLGLIASS